MNDKIALIVQKGIDGLGHYGTYVPKYLSEMGVEFDTIEYEVPKSGTRLPRLVSTTFRDFSRYHILHNMIGDLFFPLRRGRNSLIVVTAHEFQVLSYPALNKLQERRLKDKAYTIINGICQHASFENADYIIANSIQTYHEAIRLGFDKQKLFLVELGMNENFIKKPLVRKKGSKTFSVGAISPLTPRKQTFLAIDAYKRFCSVKKNTKLELWGKQVYSKDEIKRRIAGCKSIAVKGIAEEKKLVGIYDSFDVFIFLSMYEGFGLPIIEAKARGLPVIIYKHGHISPEVRKYCFEAEDAEHAAEILSSIYENGYNEKLRKRAIEDARRFTWKKTAEGTAAVYKKIS